MAQSVDRSRWILAALVLLFGAAAFLFSRCEDDRQAEERPEVAEAPEVEYPRDRADPVRLRRRSRGGQRVGDAPVDVQRAPKAQKRSRDRVEAAMGDPEGGGTVFVELNAIRHSPVAQKILKCREQEALAVLDDVKRQLGIDPAQDIDRVAISGDTLAISGYFDDLKLPEHLGEGETYGSARLFEAQGSQVDAQGARPEPVHFGVVGEDLIVTGQDPASVKAAVDRVEGKAPVQPLPPMSGARGEIYGQFTQTFIQGLIGSSQDPMMGKLSRLLEGGLIRMNVDEHVSMSLDLQTSDEPTADDLSRSLGGLIAAARIQAQEEGRPEVAQLLEKARVKPGEAGRFDVDLAVPGEVILEALGCDAEGNPLEDGAPGALVDPPQP